jgi:hypothetical protein
VVARHADLAVEAAASMAVEAVVASTVVVAADTGKP